MQRKGGDNAMRLIYTIEHLKRLNFEMFQLVPQIGLANLKLIKETSNHGQIGNSRSSLRIVNNFDSLFNLRRIQLQGFQGDVVTLGVATVTPASRA